MSKQANSISPKLDLRIVYADGATYDVQTQPVDFWRAEQVVGGAVFTAEGGVTASGLYALAYACAVRGGHAYRPHRKTTTERELFAIWIEKVADVAILTDEDDDGGEAPKDDDEPEADSRDA